MTRDPHEDPEKPIQYPIYYALRGRKRCNSIEQDSTKYEGLKTAETSSSTLSLGTKALKMSQPDDAAPMAETPRWKLKDAPRYEKVGPFGPDETLTPETAMQKAIYGSLFSGVTPMPATCPSGNCTWDPFTTLGVCNKCQDLSHLITQSTILNPVKDGLNDPMNDYPKTTTQYRLPNGLNVTLLTKDDTLAGNFPALVASNGSAHLTKIPPIPFTIATHAIMSKATAYECSVHWCLKSYHSSMTHGALVETVLTNDTTPTTYDLYNGTESPIGHCATNIWAPVFGAIKDPKIGDPVFVYAPNSSLITNCIAHLYSSAGTFTFSETTHVALQTFLQPLLTGNLTWQGLLSFAPSTAMMQTFLKYGVVGNGILSSDSQVVGDASRKFANDLSLQDVPGMMDNLTESMTVRMRFAAAADAQAGERETNTIHGIAYETQAVVNVHWAWLALPIGLLIGSMAFLGAVMVASRRFGGGMSAFKTSVMPLLFHGLDREHAEKNRGMVSKSEMAVKARDIEVRFVGVEGRGWLM